MVKRFLRGLAILAALCGIFALTGGKKAEAATSITSDTSWYDNSKTEFHISTAEELFGLAELSKNSDFQGKKIIFDADIVLNDDYQTAYASWTTGTAATNNFPGIGGDGYNVKAFKGEIDGNGKKIIGLYMQADHRSLGFVNDMTTGKVHNLTFDYCYVESKLNGLSGLGLAVGTLHAGQHRASVASNVLADPATATTKHVYDIKTTSNVMVRNEAGSSASGIGGIVGHSWHSSVDNCEFAGKIKTNGIRVGGIVGYDSAAGTLWIYNCKFSGTITQTSATNAYVGGIIGDCTGGGASANCLNINNCQVSGTISSAWIFNGGIAGNIGTNAIIGNCYVDATISCGRSSGAPCTGGIVGTFAADKLVLHQCAFTGEIKINTGAQYQQVGLILAQINGSGSTKSVTFEKCFAVHRNIEANRGAGNRSYGTVGQNVSNHDFIGWPVVLNETDMQGEGLYPYIQLDSNWKYVANNIPQLVKFSDAQAITPTYDGIKADYSWFQYFKNHAQVTTFTINTPEQYLAFCGISRAWASSNQHQWDGITFELGADLTLNEGDASTWGETAPKNKYVPIGTDVYVGSSYAAMRFSFNGNGHTISGLYIKTTGLSGMITQKVGGTVSDFTLTNSYIEGTSMRGAVVITAIAGSGTVDSVTVSDSVYLKNSATGNAWVGGIAGQAWGATIQNCNVAAKITAKGHAVGGIVGFDNAGALTLTNCKFTGSITDTNGNYQGGLIGQITCSNAISLTGCEVNGSIIGNQYVGGMIGSLEGGSTLSVDTASVTVALSGGNYLGGVIGRVNTTGGNDMTISGLTVQVTITGKEFVNGSNNSEVAGVFGQMNQGFIILSESTVNGTVYAPNAIHVAGITGTVSANSGLQVSDVTLEMDVTGHRTVAGAVGLLQGSFSANNLTVKGSYIARLHGFADSDTSSAYVGGIIGQYDTTYPSQIIGANVDATMKSSYNFTGGIIGGFSKAAEVTIGDSRVAGTVEGAYQVGGFIGKMQAGNTVTIYNSEMLAMVQNSSDDLYYRLEVNYVDTSSAKKSANVYAMESGIAEAKAKFESANPGSSYAYKVYRDHQRFGGIVGDMTSGTAANKAVLILTDVRLGGSLDAYQLDDLAGNVNAGGVVGLLQAYADVTMTRVLVNISVNGNKNGLGAIFGQSQANTAITASNLYCAEDAARKLGVVQGILGTGSTNDYAVTYFNTAKNYGAGAYTLMPSLRTGNWTLVEGDLPSLVMFLDQDGYTVCNTMKVRTISARYDGNGKLKTRISVPLQGGNDYAFTSNFTLTASTLSNNTFKGWYLSFDGGLTLGTKLSDDMTVTKSISTDILPLQMGEIYCIAVYELSNPENVTVVINAKDGGTNIPFSFCTNGGTVYPISAGYANIPIKVGATLTLTYTGAVADFDYYGWFNASNRALTRSKEWTFEVKSDTELNLVASKRDGSDSCYVTFIPWPSQVTSARYTKNSEIQIPGFQYRTGMTFNGWKIGNTLYPVANEEGIDTLVAAIKAAIDNGTKVLYVSADYTEEDGFYQVNLQKVYAKDTSGLSALENIGSPVAGAQTSIRDAASVTAPETANGYRFLFIMDANRNVLSYSRDMVYRTNADTVLYAVYGDAVANPAPSIHITSATKIDQGSGKYTVSYTATRAVPEESFEVLRQGIVYFYVANGAAGANLAVAKANLDISKNGDSVGGGRVGIFESPNVLANSATTLNLKNCNSTSSVFVQGYAVIRNKKTDEVSTVYSNTAYCDSNMLNPTIEPDSASSFNWNDADRDALRDHLFGDILLPSLSGSHIAATNGYRGYLTWYYAYTDDNASSVSTTSYTNYINDLNSAGYKVTNYGEVESGSNYYLATFNRGDAYYTVLYNPISSGTQHRLLIIGSAFGFESTYELGDLIPTSVISKTNQAKFANVGYGSFFNQGGTVEITDVKLTSAGFKKEMTTGNGGAIYTKNNIVVQGKISSGTTMNYAEISVGRKLSPNLYASAATSDSVNAHTTFTSLMTTSDGTAVKFGNDYIIELKNGHFVIFDGGNGADAQNLINYLLERATANKTGTPVVDGWFITHLHGDHVGALYRIINTPSYANQIRVNGIYFSSLARNWLWDLDAYQYQVELEYHAPQVFKTQTGASTPTYRVAMTDRYYFSNITVDVLMTQAQVKRSDMSIDINDTSSWYLVNVGSQTFFNAGDAYTTAFKAYQTYGKAISNVTIMSAYHHGLNYQSTTTTSYKKAMQITPEKILVTNWNEAALLAIGEYYYNKWNTYKNTSYAKNAQKIFYKDYTNNRWTFTFSD